MLISLLSFISCSTDEIEEVIETSTLVCYACSQNGYPAYTTCESTCNEGSNCKADLEQQGYVCTKK